MKRLLLSALAFCAGISSLFGQNFALNYNSSEQITLQHNLFERPIAETLIGDDLYKNFTQTYEIVSAEAGAPALPFFAESVIVPHKGKVNFVVSHEGYTEYENVLIAPSKGNLKRNTSPSEVPYLFGEVYSTDGFYPGELATLSAPFNLRNTRGVTTIINPYQYNPVTKVLRVYKNITVDVLINETVPGINELTPRAEHSEAFNLAYHTFYLNTGEVMGRYSPVEEEGEMLIISADALTDEIQPLADWKIQKGIKTTIATKSEVGATDAEIKAYIADFYTDHPDLVFVLLVGDHDQIPAHTYGTAGWEELWSDSYYGQLTGSDYYPELFIGRFSGSASEIEVMVERTLEYEKTPAEGDWMTRAIGLASNEGAGYGDDGEADWQHARNNRAKLLTYGYTEIHEFYDGSQGGEDAPGNPTSDMISPAVNEGVGLFNYTGHGDEFTCITGNYSSGDIDAATNDGKYPFVISVACNNGTFTSGTCISETWLRATNGDSPTGAIAACGSTILMAWAEPMQTQDEMSDIIAESYESNRKATLGGIFYNAQMSMLEAYSSSATAIEVMQTWVMFGDPSAVFRNKVTMHMAVTHVPSIYIAETSVAVNCDVEDAKVAIVQNDQILGTATVTGGVATISFSELTSDAPLKVTVTKQNYAPYQGDIEVINGFSGITDNAPAAVTVYPNPANEQFTVNWKGLTTPTSIELNDLSGKVIYKGVPNGNTLTVNTTNYAPGIYLLSVTIAGDTQVSKLIIR